MNKLPVKITVDSVCDLPLDILKKYGIVLFNYLVETPDGRYIDNKEIGSEDLITYLMNPEHRAKSASPWVSDYRWFFENETREPCQIIHFTMGSGSSHGYQSACKAAEGLPVTVIDSGTLSSTMGLIAIRAAKLAILGKDAETIIRETKTYSHFQKCTFIVKDPEYLHRSGRLSTTVLEVSRRFLLRPILKLSGGAIRFKTFAMGDWEWCMRRYVALALRNTRGIDNSVVFITNVGLSPEEIEFIKAEIAKHYKFKKVIPVRASAAVSCNGGAGTFGVLFARGSVIDIPQGKLAELSQEPKPAEIVPDSDPLTDNFNSDPDVIPENHISEEEEKLALIMQLSLLDVETGLHYVGGSLVLYREIVEEFARVNKTETLNQFLAMGDWENYRVAIHSLKSSAKTIGAMELSESARKLELACKDGDYDYVRENHKLVMMEYNAVFQECQKS